MSSTEDSYSSVALSLTSDLSSNWTESSNMWGGSVKRHFHHAANKTKRFLKSGSAASQIVLAILVILVVILIVHVLRTTVLGGLANFRESRVCVEGGKTLCPKTSIVVPGKQFHRSKNELGGSEFTYAFWIFIEDWSYKYGQWKHILHKGNSSAWPNRAPGIWLHPRENSMRFYMNTYNSIAGNYIDIQNIPLNKWFHIVFSVNQLTMDVYVNGNLRKSLKFTSLPKQNYGDLFIMSFRGFDGYLSRLCYYNYAVPYSEVEKLLEQGPAPIQCIGKGEMPPYLTPTWWVSTYQSGAPEYA